VRRERCTLREGEGTALRRSGGFGSGGGLVCGEDEAGESQSEVSSMDGQTDWTSLFADDENGLLLGCTV
jgi:hypothetical protein